MYVKTAIFAEIFIVGIMDIDDTLGDCWDFGLPDFILYTIRVALLEVLFSYLFIIGTCDMSLNFNFIFFVLYPCSPVILKPIFLHCPKALLSFF